MKITKLAKTIALTSLVVSTVLASNLILAMSDKNNSINLDLVNKDHFSILKENTEVLGLKQELDNYKIANNSGMSGNEAFYNKFKTNREAIIENNCISSVSEICIELKNERVELKEDYKYYHIGSYNMIKAFYSAQIEKDSVFLDIKEEASSYLANKTLNENFHNKAEAIVYSM